MSYQSQDFDDLSDPELTLIEGPNGSGKSSIWDGISWILFGQTVRGVKNDDVINRKFKKDCEVELSIQLRGDELRIKRYRKHSRFGDRLFFTYRGATTELGTLADTQKSLLELLQIDFELFRCSILFAQGETFNFVNAGNKAQKEILSKVMRVDYSNGLDEAKRIIKKFDNEAAENERKLAVLNSHLEAQVDWESEIKEFEDARQAAIDSIQEDIDAITSEIKTASAKLKSSTEDSDSQMKDLNFAKEKLEKSAESIKNKYFQIRSKVEALKDQNKELKDLSGECPTCYQDIDEEQKADMIAANDKEIQKLSDELKSVTELEKIALEKRKENSEKIEALRNRLAANKAVVEKIRGLNARKKDYEARLKEKQDEENPALARKEKDEERKKEIAAKIKQIEKKQIEIQNLQPYYDFWVNAFGDSGIKSFIFDLICSSLTNKSNKYLNILTDGAITISFDTQKKLKTGELREKFDCEILKDGERVEYESYSGGEKRRISLAVDMALSEIMSEYYGQKFSMVVFDEQTGYMDEGGRVGFMNLLREIAREKRVFVVDHDAEFKAMFDMVWTVQKKSGISRVIA
jgi:DNA repair exonuclease SbcCD ATPase subunit